MTMYFTNEQDNQPIPERIDYIRQGYMGNVVKIALEKFERAKAEVDAASAKLATAEAAVKAYDEALSNFPGEAETVKYSELMSFMQKMTITSAEVPERPERSAQIALAEAEASLSQAKLAALRAVIKSKAKDFAIVDGVGMTGGIIMENLLMAEDGTLGCIRCADDISAVNLRVLFIINHIDAQFNQNAPREVLFPSEDMPKIHKLLKYNKFNFLFEVARILLERVSIENVKGEGLAENNFFANKANELKEIYDAVVKGFTPGESYTEFLERVQGIIATKLADSNSSLNQPTGHFMRLFQSLPIVGSSISTGSKEALLECQKIVAHKIQLRQLPAAAVELSVLPNSQPASTLVPKYAIIEAS